MKHNNVTAEDFWQTSLTLYAKPGVAQICLQLQDDFHCNVNVLLFVVYCEIKQVSLSTNQLDQLTRAIAKSDEAICEARQKRRQAKHSAPKDYEALKAKELALEKCQQQELVNTYHQFSHDPNGGSSVSAYLDWKQHPLGHEGTRILQQLFDLTLPPSL